MPTYLNMSKIRCLIYRSGFKNVQTRQKKLKKNWLLGSQLSINDNTESPQI